MHKNLLKPVEVKIHSSHTSKLNLLDSDCIFLDFSIKVSAFKSGLKRYLFQKQSNGGKFDWSINNYESNGYTYINIRYNMSNYSPSHTSQ